MVYKSFVFYHIKHLKNLLSVIKCMSRFSFNDHVNEYSGSKLHGHTVVDTYRFPANDSLDQKYYTPEVALFATPKLSEKVLRKGRSVAKRGELPRQNLNEI